MVDKSYIYQLTNRANKKPPVFWPVQCFGCAITNTEIVRYSSALTQTKRNERVYDYQTLLTMFKMR